MISKMKSEDTAKTRNTGPIKVMTVREVAAYLRVAPITVYRMLKRNEIPAFHMGSDWRFNIEAIDRWRLRQESRAISRFPPAQVRIVGESTRS